MKECTRKTNRYYYKGREVIILKDIEVVDTVIICFLDDKKELRSVNKSCLESTPLNYRKIKFIRINTLARLY